MAGAIFSKIPFAGKQPPGSPLDKVAFTPFALRLDESSFEKYNFLALQRRNAVSLYTPCTMLICRHLFVNKAPSVSVWSHFQYLLNQQHSLKAQSFLGTCTNKVSCHWLWGCTSLLPMVNVDLWPCLLLQLISKKVSHPSNTITRHACNCQGTVQGPLWTGPCPPRKDVFAFIAQTGIMVVHYLALFPRASKTTGFCGLDEGEQLQSLNWGKKQNRNDMASHLAVFFCLFPN